MTDVRLTALNPEDSQVYPVACNSSGELLVSKGDEPEDKYVEKSGDNMSGSLTLGTDKITLDATGGSIAAVGSIDTGSAGSAEYASLKPDGRATFLNKDNGQYVWINNNTGDGAIVINNSNSSTASSANCVITKDGSADFAGSITSDTYIQSNDLIHNSTTTLNTVKNGVPYAIGVYPSDSAKDYTFTVSPDGSALFKSDVVIGSRNKSWMIVEQSGLAHLVEQASFDAEFGVKDGYPKLRDIPGELDLVEKALSEVMEKLRLVPPAGWPVWDGSDETQ